MAGHLLEKVEAVSPLVSHQLNLGHRRERQADGLDLGGILLVCKAVDELLLELFAEVLVDLLPDTLRLSLKSEFDLQKGRQGCS